MQSQAQLAQPSVALPLGASPQIPLVIDSPHSGRIFPTEGRCAAGPEALLSGWDAYVDRLWAAAPEVGATLVAAQFSRMFLDLNRDEQDIDPSMLEAPLAGINPSAYAMRGMGLIRRLALPGVPMYDRQLSVAEVRARIEGYYRPYHAALARALDTSYAHFGGVWHINGHSMKSIGNAMNIDNGQERPDLVVSDLDGVSADPAFTRWVADCWRELGYRVNINEPYKGGAIVRRYGLPGLNRHSIQIEINRALYMDERTFEPHEGMRKLESDVRAFLERLRKHIKHLLAGPQPIPVPAAR